MGLGRKNLENLSTVSAEMIRDYASGQFGPVPVIYRVAVLEVDHIGGVLSGPSGRLHKNELSNPKGSILGQIVTDAMDLSTPEDQYLVFWPLFSHDLMPVKEGEHVYALFEDLAQRYGFWIARIPEPDDVGNFNYTSGVKRFASKDIKEGQAASERIVRDLEDNPKEIVLSEEFQSEPDAVSDFNSRTGDRIIHGSNNTAIILSRDRIDVAGSGVKEKAGAIDIVAGRIGSDVSLSDDAARVVVAMKSDVDANFAIEAGESAGEVSAVAIKADEIRIVARNGMKLVVESGSTSIVIDKDGKVSIETPESVEVSAKEMVISTDDDIVLDAGGKVLVGSSDASHSLVRADSLKTYLDGVFDVFAASVVDVAGIPGIGVTNSAVGSAVKAIPWTDVPSPKNKVE